MRISIFGSGYVGLVTAACLAEVGNHVLCVDVHTERINQLQQGKIPIYEPGLANLVHANQIAQRLQFTTDEDKAITHGEIQCIAVGTPPDEDGSADLRYVLQVAETIGRKMTDYKLVINKSTVPVGTADKVSTTIRTALQTRQLNLEFDVVSNPEFLKEGAAIDDFMKPDRIIIGANGNRPIELMSELYAPFNRNRNKLIVMDARSAELTKYAANAMLATRISFMNEMANLAEKVGADIEQVRIGIGSDPRIGFHFIYPGAGYGGSCFGKDLQALIRIAHNSDREPFILQAVETVNHRQKQILFNKVQHYFKNDLRGRRFALWGLAFKPNTDDMRDAASRPLMESLWEAGAIVQAFDPQAMDETRRLYGSRPDLQLCNTPEEALYQAEALIIVTEWKVFRSPNFELIKTHLVQPLIFDGRNLYDPRRMREMGFAYYAIGRGDSVQ